MRLSKPLPCEVKAYEGDESTCNEDVGILGTSSLDPPYDFPT